MGGASGQRMNRRGFLAALVAGLTLDPERLLWVPGRKLISVPAPEVVIEPSVAEIVAAQLDVIRPKLMEMFLADPFPSFSRRLRNA